MSDIVIKAENISKLYKLGTIGSGSLRRDMQLWWEDKILNKENPNKYITGGKKIDNNEIIWALKNIDFEIKQGEALGIIGHNGAGKSTLLKILSRIVKPTEGVIRGRGRVSSLLEVGTGFHAELTGRENIFVSGHILGMKKAEILKKFDEIVDFSGVEAFIDTPVKRYSSGMYVRLAFAVAAHLEPDILIIDEVLAVGDADFQKKCLGKMNDASTKSGRTVIFVSHNLQAVSNLCPKAIWLDKGSVRSRGTSKTVINDYLSTLQKKSWKKEFTDLKNAPGNDFIKVFSVELKPQFVESSSIIDIRTPLTIKFRFYNTSDNILLAAGIHLFTLSGECIFDVSNDSLLFEKGFIDGECNIPGNFLNNGSYYISIIFVEDSSKQLYYYEECLSFDVEDYRENMNWYGDWMGYVRPKFPVILKQSK
ncbi:ABC transporter ATP-binding protein [Mariniflexile sp.]|uniref:ABC transporter ATP-binding protein n=1 Tax=Mariniflexile sp. TaxID=1979402 RepID=UPI0035636A99